MLRQPKNAEQNVDVHLHWTRQSRSEGCCSVHGRAARRKEKQEQQRCTLGGVKYSAGGHKRRASVITVGRKVGGS